MNPFVARSFRPLRPLPAPRRAIAARSIGFFCLWIAACLGLFSGAAHAVALVDISNVPLFGGRQPHPNVVVTTSVEFPTVGSAYLNDQNGVPVPYLQANSYIGYFDSSKCYLYSGTSSNGYFYVSGNVDGNHECSGAFSGNFMNWATMSAIDEFRYAMTGGNRVDENGANNGTVLERAVLPDGSINGVPDFYALASNFPRHTLSGGTIDGVASSSVPAILPFTNSTLYVTNCRNTVFFGTGGGGNCFSPDADVGTYQVRVLVCDNTEGPVRNDLCLQYGAGGKYKPVGQVELNANQMRFAVFGYLMDHDYPGYSAPCNDQGWDRCRYGGVLRAPMGYVGPTTYDASQNASANTHSGINTDGSFVTDPEGTALSAGGYSGFINYINKFGSSGTYKRFDPAGEMFYEAIRYYENLQPTDIAIAGMTDTMKDGFPVVTTWTDPILSACSPNYIINLSDANTWDDTYLPGFNNNITPGPGRPSYRAPDAAGLDASLWTTHIGDLESDTTIPSITPNDVRRNLAGLQNQMTGGTGTSSQLVSGAAFWANTNDIRSDLPGTQTIKTISFDVAEGSTDIHDRSLYLMGKYGGFNNTIDRSTDTYPDPFYSADPNNVNGPAIRSNSEWEDSAGSAYPANYLLASDPQKLINGLRAAFARINAQTGTLSGASLTSANLTNGPAGAYIATFNPLRWSGSVLFNSVSVDSMTGLLTVSTSPIWNSATLLDARCGTVVSASTVCTDTSTALGKRNIVTTLTVSGVRVAANFTDAAIAADANYLAALNTNPASGAADGLAQQRINYLRGYRADEVSSLGFRGRDSAMGDIINSGPVYIGPPSATIPDADYQAGFFAAHVNRTQAVYVGANDGMLHALDAQSGNELFSYIPGYSYANLNDLTNPGYQHDTFVDTVPKVQEVKINGNWTTVLVGANGNGAQGIFGLDVSDPSSFGPSKVLFEFSDADDADFGNVLAAPEIAKLKVGVDGSLNPIYRYFAVVTGYNNRRTSVNGHVNGDTHVSTDTTNSGVLFLIALDHVLNTAWVQGTDYYKFTFPASNSTLANGLGPVTILQSRSGDQSTAAMYFGDLQGNLWRFNTVGTTPATWVPALGTLSSPQPIFVATDANGVPQPITARVELAGGPFGGTLVVFGTGEYLGLSDAILPGAQQSEYALLDTASATVISRTADLVPRTATVTSGTVSITGAAFNYSGAAGKKGWYLDFPNSSSVGERSITKPAIRTNLLTFTTLTLATDICGGGSGYIYQVNALTGLPFLDSTNNTLLPGGYISTVGIPGPPRIVELKFTPGVQHPAGVDINTQRQTTLVAGTLGKIDSTRDASGNATAINSKTPPSGRISWREISNWNDLTGH